MADNFIDKNFLVEKASPVVVAGGAGVGCAIAAKNSVIKAKAAKQETASTVRTKFINNEISKTRAIHERKNFNS